MFDKQNCIAVVFGFFFSSRKFFCFEGCAKPHKNAVNILLQYTTIAYNNIYLHYSDKFQRWKKVYETSRCTVTWCQWFCGMYVCVCLCLCLHIYLGNRVLGSKSTYKLFEIIFFSLLHVLMNCTAHGVEDQPRQQQPSNSNSRTRTTIIIITEHNVF